MKEALIMARLSGLRTYADGNTTVFQNDFVTTQVAPGSSSVGNRKDPLPWKYSTVHQTPPRMQISNRNYGYPYDYTEEGYVTNIHPYPRFDRGPDVSYAYNRALSRLNEKVRGSLDLSIDLAEAGQTKRMLNATRQFEQFANQVLGNRKYKNLRLLTERWLEYQYGWRPLLSDIKAAADESLRVVINRINDVKSSATVRDDDKGSFDSQLGPYPVRASDTLKFLRGVRFHMTYEIPEESFDIRRWTSLNPVSIAWELMPYSFVIDWFVDIGSTLRNVETALLYRTANFRSGYYTTLSVNEGSAKVGRQKIGPNVDVFMDLMTRKEVSYERVVLSSYPFPMAPSFRVNLGTERLLSAASLLANFLPKR